MDEGTAAKRVEARQSGSSVTQRERAMVPPELQYVVGIDVAKQAHVVCALEAPSGAVLQKPSRLEATAQGYALLGSWLGAWGAPEQTLIGLEATGPLWEPRWDGYTDAPCVLLCPLLIESERRMQRAASRGAAQLVAGAEGRWRDVTASEGVLCLVAASRWPLVCYTRAAKRTAPRTKGRHRMAQRWQQASLALGFAAGANNLRIASSHAANTAVTQGTHAPAGTQAPKAWVTTQHFSGHDNQQTPSFSATGTWRIVWTCKTNNSSVSSGAFSVELNRDDGTPVDLVATPAATAARPTMRTRATGSSISRLTRCSWITTSASRTIARGLA